MPFLAYVGGLGIVICNVLYLTYREYYTDLRSLDREQPLAGSYRRVPRCSVRAGHPTKALFAARGGVSGTHYVWTRGGASRLLWQPRTLHAPRDLLSCPPPPFQPSRRGTHPTELPPPPPTSRLPCQLLHRAGASRCVRAYVGVGVGAVERADWLVRRTRRPNCAMQAHSAYIWEHPNFAERFPHMLDFNTLGAYQQFPSAYWRRVVDKIDFKRVYTELTFAIGPEFIRHTLDDSAPIADLQGNEKSVIIRSVIATTASGNVCQPALRCPVAGKQQVTRKEESRGTQDRFLAEYGIGHKHLSRATRPQSWTRQLHDLLPWVTALLGNDCSNIDHVLTESVVGMCERFLSANGRTRGSQRDTRNPFSQPRAANPIIGTPASKEPTCRFMSTEQCRNAGLGERETPLENPPTNGIVRYDTHTRNSGSEPLRDSNHVRLGGRRIALTTTPPRPPRHFSSAYLYIMLQEDGRVSVTTSDGSRYFLRYTKGISDTLTPRIRTYLVGARKIRVILKVQTKLEDTVGSCDFYHRLTTCVHSSRTVLVHSKASTAERPISSKAVTEVNGVVWLPIANEITNCSQAIVSPSHVQFTQKGRDFTVVSPSHVQFTQKGRDFTVVCPSHVQFTQKGRDFTVVCPSHVQFTQKGRDFTVVSPSHVQFTQKGIANCLQHRGIVHECRDDSDDRPGFTTALRVSPSTARPSYIRPSLAERFTTKLRTSFQDKIDVKHVYTEVDFANGSQFIRHVLDDSEPIADLLGNMQLLHVNTKDTGATMAERLARSPPTKTIWVQTPAGSPDFRMLKSCRTMPLVGGFSRGSPVSPNPFIPAPLHIHFNHLHRLSRPRC
ncbi:hypothetical protein PR048_030728 [Dryococelus australis]|uniref:Uncharacterized protein n=1 Tax=Dryococelus australis TaxID=614101 RepID=A0ABQ9G9R2_9NEOP|nr:hypothetical protein PR048_030728 [Dryococelus australis]